MKLLEWLMSLFRAPAAAVPGAAPVPPEEPVKGDPAWLKLARVELGVKEAPGAANNPTVLAYYRDAGHPEINADSVAWCAAFCGAMLERAGTSSSKMLNARSYLNWGKEVTKPYPGCVAVFSRGDPRSWEGHVGFFLREVDGHVEILAGNQGDAVSIGREPKSRLLGYREPVKASNSRIIKAATASMALAGAGGAVVLDSQTQLMGISEIFKSMGVTIPAFQILSYGLQIMVLCIIVWARWDMLKGKGQ